MAKAFMCDDCGCMSEGAPFKGNPIARVEDDVLTVEVFTMRCKLDLCEGCTTKRLRDVLQETVLAAEVEEPRRGKAGKGDKRSRGVREVALVDA